MSARQNFLLNELISVNLVKFSIIYQNKYPDYDIAFRVFALWEWGSVTAICCIIFMITNESIAA